MHRSSPEAESDLMQTIRLSLRDVRREWNQKIEKLTNAISDLRVSSGLSEHSAVDGSAVFDQLLDLFTLSQASEEPPTEAIANLTKLYFSSPETFEFYIPQLIVFLLYGSFDVTSLLQEALLEICESSLTFAHKLHWFVVSFCLSGAGVAPEGVAALHLFLQDIEARGIVSARRVKALLAADPSSQSLSSSHGHGEGEEKMSLLLYEHGSEILHSSSSSAYFKSVLSATSLPPPDSLNEFSVTVAFWESLTELSLLLGSIPRETRTDQLRARLGPIEDKFLPSATVYSPVFGHGHHRIFGIQIEECFAFSTKERAPVFICLEIIEISSSQKKSV
jgi:phosphatidylinositol 4-kinase B